MSQIALITGATSGLGAAFAQRLAAEETDLVIVARDEERLTAKATELSQAYGVKVETIPADLSTDEGIERVAARLSRSDEPVDLLINNAGFGMHGAFLENPICDHEKMLAVNVRAVLALSHAALGVMVPRGTGGVLNISSVAAYTPGLRPASTYAATKAFVSALTEGLHSAFADTGVTISAVCPGFIRTEFHNRAGINMSKMPGFMWLDADRVAETALRDHRAGRVFSIPGAHYKAMMLALRFAPRVLVAQAAKILRKRAN